MDTVRIGIIGIGGMGSHHARYLNAGEVPNAQLAAVCDIDPARLKWAETNLNSAVRHFASAEELFAAQCVDAVMIATPHYGHPVLGMQAIEQGLHVLSEKPAGVFTKNVREMNEAAKRGARVYGIMFNQRTHANHQKMRDLVQSGELGKIQRINWIITDWFRTQSYYNSGGWRATWAGEGGGVLINQCPHNLDLWQWICGMPRRIRAFCEFGRFRDIEVEDSVTAYAEYENGATALFVTTTGEAPGTNRFEICGSRGKLVLEHGALTFWRNRVDAIEFNQTFTGGFGTPECWKCDVPTPGGSEGHKGITKDWVRAIRTGSPLLGPGEEGINSLTLSNAMHLSTWTDDWVELPIDEDLYYRHLQKRIKASRAGNKATAKKGGRKLDVTGTFGS
jgi:predicted dehydrogenase